MAWTALCDVICPKFVSLCPTSLNLFFDFASAVLFFSSYFIPWLQLKPNIMIWYDGHIALHISCAEVVAHDALQLEVSVDADDNQLKRGYRKAAMKVCFQAALFLL